MILLCETQLVHAVVNAIIEVTGIAFFHHLIAEFLDEWDMIAVNSSGIQFW